MFVYRAKVIETTQSGTCKVQVFAATGNSEIEADICSQKGFYSHYSRDEIVYVAWLGEKDWIILGCPNPELSEEIENINVKQISAKSGTLYGDILLSQITPGIKNPVEIGEVKIKNLVAAYEEVSRLRSTVALLNSKIEKLESTISLITGGAVT